QIARAFFVHDTDGNGARTQHPPEVLLELFIVADDQSDELCHDSLLSLLLLRCSAVHVGLDLGGGCGGLGGFGVLPRLFLRGLLLPLPVLFGLLAIFLSLFGGELGFFLLRGLEPLLLLLAGAFGLLLLRARHLARRGGGRLRHDRRRRHDLHRHRNRRARGGGSLTAVVAVVIGGPAGAREVRRRHFDRPLRVERGQ